MSTSDHSTTSINKGQTYHHTANSDPRINKLTLGNGQPYNTFVEENNIYNGYKGDPYTKVIQTNPLLYNTDRNPMNAAPIAKFDMPNDATDFDKLSETLAIQEISYLFTIDLPSLVEIDVPESVGKGIDGCQDDLVSHNNELEWEISSYINESENTPKNAFDRRVNNS